MVPNDTPKEQSITLNNFLHRIDCKTTIIELVTQYNCRLKRIRRSKNWSLIGKQSQLIDLSKQLRQDNVECDNTLLDKTKLDKQRWIADAIDKALPKPTFDLALIIQSNPDMTINRLIAETGCTLIEARHAIDLAEGLI